MCSSCFCRGKDSFSLRISSSDPASTPSSHPKCVSVRSSVLPRTSSKITSSLESIEALGLVELRGALDVVELDVWLGFSVRSSMPQATVVRRPVL